MFRKCLPLGMVGHSKWSKVKHITGPLDGKRGAAFRKPVKEITVAAKIGGGDLSGYPRLHAVVETARGQTLPREHSAFYDGTQHSHPNFDVSEKILARLDA